ncbi:uncharacterized protein HD556DRAFT_1435379 [Suillus plorans]|uniref:CxC2-like cysteine cluster KDZ transposase-associated domain-containing protein n=1 Tax=Suillus plorans TaxID=116603 RepID=A0A9P7A9N9_9AGAM|nr:uncharacterized protein HD556DRAFT_1435379 [Suillus plorans]KAG1784678.1 hypothetical protein HD556DRAFT_1435379 [Suillus plorans]
MVIVDKYGVHRLEVRCCDCPNAMSPDIQMFQHGFFLTSFNRPKTVMFPHLVPDRYRELMKVARQWRQLKTMKWYGFGHCSDTPNAGDLALFCPACPQPGINVFLSGDESLDDWKYTWSFVMDGNFKAKHLHPIKPFDEVWLSDGLGFMVGKERYKNHLAEAADTACTGIGGVACARHSCFVSHAMVDLQKGERQAEHL